ncbi:MAG: pilus assembly protein TadG-related protein [Alphaproteobacteria bacterium]|nr:pilus assembly protein TadG-related protein [Alphaproteobacteria bacterium]
MKRLNFLPSFLRAVRSFARSEGGMTLPLLALSMVVMTGATGVAIDTARMQLAQSKLQFSLDAAGLAAGSTVNTASLNSEVGKYLNANFNGYMGATITGTNANVDDSNTIITLSASASLPTTFMNVLGVSTMTVNANSEISRAVTGLELVLVLDNTGSMTGTAGGGVTKLAALKTASTTLVNTLFANPSVATNGKLWVGIVPFSQAVNIGTSHDTWMDSTYSNALSGMALNQGPGWGPTSWTGCVDARLNGEDVTDTPPSQGNVNTLFQQYYWPSDNLNYGAPYNNSPNSGDNDWATRVYSRCKNGSCTTVTGSCSTSNGYTCTLTGYNYASPLNTSQQGPNLMCPQEVTPLTNNKTTLLNHINSMVAQGNTVIPQGLQWGWHMLSPRWQGLWGGTMGANGLPLAYDAPGMNKAIVLLTDGENTIDNGSHSNYWFLQNGRLGTTNSSTAVTNLNSRTQTLCTALKNKGVYIYTVMLGTQTTTTSLNLLKNCATAQNYFFNSPSTSQLQGIFNAIGDSLSNLRVSQ